MAATFARDHVAMLLDRIESANFSPAGVDAG
jgi:hypothetical protein